MEFWRNHHIFDLRGFRGTACCGVARCGAGDEFCRKKTVKGCFFRVSRKNLDDFLIAIIIVRPSGRCQWFAAKKTKIRRRDWKWLETCRIIQGIITKIIRIMRWNIWKRYAVLAISAPNADGRSWPGAAPFPWRRPPPISSAPAASPTCSSRPTAPASACGCPAACAAKRTRPSAAPTQCCEAGASAWPAR